jgi:hypothetical protein
MANQTPKGLLDVGWETPVETEPFTLIDVDMGETIKGLAVDMDQVIDELSFRNSTRAREVSEAYKKDFSDTLTRATYYTQHARGLSEHYTRG